MFGSENFFPAPLDTDAQSVAKAVRLTSAILGQNGRVTVSDTSVNIPTLGQSAFGLIIATAATVINTLESVDPVTNAFVSANAVSMAAGESRFGFFTYVKLTSGSVILFPLAKQGEVPAVPALAGAFAVGNGVTLNVTRKSGGAPPSTIVVQRKVNAGAYANLVPPIVDADGNLTLLDSGPGSSADVVKYRAFYAEPYSSGVSRGRQGDYSNEVTITLP